MDEKTNRLDALAEPMRAAVIQECRRSCEIYRKGDPAWLCYKRNHACFNCQERAAAHMATA